MEWKEMDSKLWTILNHVKNLLPFCFCFYLCDLIKNLDLTVYRSETI